MTMNEQNTSVIPFAFDDALVRALWVENDPWFVLVDVCRVLGIANSRDAASRLDDDEKADVGITDTSSNGVEQGRSVTVVSESGLYALIFRSRKPEAVRFRKWVTSEVIPSLRKTGRYAMPGLEDGADLGTGALPLNERRLWVDAITLSLRVHGRAAARLLWAQSPLPQVSAEQVWQEQADSGEDLGGVAQFMTACTRPEPESWIEATPLYVAYAGWCAGVGRRPVTVTAFGRRLASLGVPKRKKARMSYGEFVLLDGGDQ
jgi:prophage antirepressor-like protein